MSANPLTAIVEAHEASIYYAERSQSFEQQRDEAITAYFRSPGPHVSDVALARHLGISNVLVGRLRRAAS